MPPRRYVRPFDGRMLESGRIEWYFLQRRQRLHHRRNLPKWKLHGRDDKDLRGARPVSKCWHMQYKHRAVLISGQNQRHAVCLCIMRGRYLPASRNLQRRLMQYPPIPELQLPLLSL